MRSDIMATTGRVIALLLTIAGFVWIFLSAVRPWHLHWGATEDEVRARLPGDELLLGETGSTHAITIEAPTAVVWRWLAQLGQDRGGFFSYELLEDLVGAEMENRDTLDPRAAPWKVGDKLWMYPPAKLNGAGHAVVLRVDPERALVFGTWQFGTDMRRPSNGTWSFLLVPMGAERTRLIVRGRAAGERSLALTAFDRLLFEPIHFLMERKMLGGIKARAEQRRPSPLADSLEVALFAAAFLLLLNAAVRLFRWPKLLPGIASLVAAAAAFQILTFLQPPWFIGLFIIAVVGASFSTLRHHQPQRPRSA